MFIGSKIISSKVCIHISNNTHTSVFNSKIKNNAFLIDIHDVHIIPLGTYFTCSPSTYI